MATAAVLLIPTFIEFGSALYVQSALILLPHWPIFCVRSNQMSQLRFAESVQGCAPRSIKRVVYCFAAFNVAAMEKGNRSPHFGSSHCLCGTIYLRNLLSTGNPFFPMMWTTFGGAGWDEWRAMAYDTTLQNYGAGRDVINTLLLPIRMIFTRDMTDGFQGSIGPIVWTIIIWGLFKRKDNFWSISLVAWVVIWASNVQQIRFLMPLIPVMVAVSAAKTPKNKAVQAALVLGAALWSIEPAQFLWKRQATTEVLTQQISEQSFLNQKLPENHPIEEWLNAALSQSVAGLDAWIPLLSRQTSSH